MIMLGVIGVIGVIGVMGVMGSLSLGVYVVCPTKAPDIGYLGRPLTYVLCLYVHCPMSYVLCPMCYVLCPMSYVLCAMCYVLWLMIKRSGSPCHCPRHTHPWLHRN
jgi:hypothetical protein